MKRARITRARETFAAFPDVVELRSECWRSAHPTDYAGQTEFLFSDKSMIVITDNDETRVHFLRDSFRILRDMFLIRFKRYQIPADARPERVRRGIPEVSAGGDASR